MGCIIKIRKASPPITLPPSIAGWARHFWRPKVPKSLLQSLGAFGHKTTTHQKTGIAAFGGYQDMKAFRVWSQKQMLRGAIWKFLHLFFDFAGTGDWIVLRVRLSDMSVLWDTAWVTPVHPACAGPVLPIAEIGLSGFGLKARIILAIPFHKSSG